MENTEQNNVDETGTSQDASQYLTFRLDDEVFALAIDRVREVLQVIEVTKVPRTPDFMRGVINLRGSVVPVVDMKCKFGLGDTKETRDTCIIITEVQIDGERAALGALADSVQEVIVMNDSQIGPPPRIGTRLRTEFLRGMGRHDDRFLMVLDIDQVFSNSEIEAVQEGGAIPASEVPETGGDEVSAA